MKNSPYICIRIISMVCAIALLSSCSGKRRQADKPDSLLAAVKKGTLLIVVKGSGEIRADKSNKIIPKIKRQATIEFLVPEGQRITNGQVIARFNTDEIENRIRDLNAKLMDARVKLENAETEREIQKMDNEANLKLAEQGVRSAQLELDKFTLGDEPLERRNAELKVWTTKSELARAEKRHAEIQGLLKEGFVTEDQVEEERIALEKAKVAFETAKVELDILNEYTLPLKKTKADNVMAKAKTELEKALKRNVTLLNNKIQAVESRKTALERTQRELVKQNKELDECVVKAPTDGVVTYGDPRQPWRRTQIFVGAKVSSGQVMMTIPDMTKMKAVINIPEADIHKVKTGQMVTMTVEALAGRTFSGRVTKSAEVANPQGWMRSDVKEFEVDVSIENGQDLKPSFSCNAEIITDTILSTLFVPVQAVFREGDDFFVYRVKGKQADRAEVKIGKSSDTHVQIISGINEGDKVFLTIPDERQIIK